MYHILLNCTKLNKHDMSTAMGRLLRYLEDDDNMDPINLFLIPEIDQRSGK